MLSNLVELAQENSSEKRRDLMGQVADLFVEDSDNHSDRELSLFGEVLIKLLDQSELPDRADIAGKVAPIEQTPRDLVLKLADDEAEVASPVLQHSPVLTTDDLLRLAKIKGQDHLLAISKRDQLEGAVTDVLLERGEQPVRRSVASNSGAELSTWGARFLVKLAGEDEVIRDSMADRKDLTREVFDKLVTLLPKDRQEKLKKLTEVDEQAATELLEKADQVAEEGRLEQRKQRLNSKIVLQQISKGEKTVDDIVTEYCAEEWFMDLAFILAKLANLEEKYVKNVMFKFESEGIAVLCRGLGVRPEGYAAMCAARCQRLNLPQSMADKWGKDFEELKSEDAERTLRFVKVRAHMNDASAA